MRPLCEGAVGTLQKRFIEPKVLKAIGDVIRQPQVQALISEEFDHVFNRMAAKAADRRPGIETERKKLRASRQRLVKAIARGVVSDADARDELNEIAHRIENVQAEIERMKFKGRHREQLRKEKTKLVEMAADFTKLAGSLDGGALRELIRPWLQSAVVDKVKRTVTLTIRRIPQAGMFLLLDNQPGRD